METPPISIPLFYDKTMKKASIFLICLVPVGVALGWLTGWLWPFVTAAASGTAALAVTERDRRRKK